MAKAGVFSRQTGRMDEKVYRLLKTHIYRFGLNTDYSCPLHVLNNKPFDDKITQFAVQTAAEPLKRCSFHLTFLAKSSTLLLVQDGW